MVWMLVIQALQSAMQQVQGQLGLQPRSPTTDAWIEAVEWKEEKGVPDCFSVSWLLVAYIKLYFLIIGTYI